MFPYCLHFFLNCEFNDGLVIEIFFKVKNKMLGIDNLIKIDMAEAPGRVDISP